MHEPADFLDLCERANHSRRRGAANSAVESELERTYGPSERLAVYGTLAPGEINHHVVQPLGGAWSVGYVTGELSLDGWGAQHGFPGLKWRATAPRVRVHVLVSAALPSHWSELDEFEGDGYVRTLVPVFKPGERTENALSVANIYEVA